MLSRVFGIFCQAREIGRLCGHGGAVKTLQVEAHLCATGATDGAVRLWDLRRVRR